MLPRSIPCEECGNTALVRGYGRVEYDWNTGGEFADAARTGGQDATTLTIRSVRLTIDCPHCGLQVQDYYPAGSDRRAHSAHSEKRRQVTRNVATLLAGSPQLGPPEIHR